MSAYTAQTFERFTEMVVQAQSGQQTFYRQFLEEVYPFILMVVKRKVGSLMEAEDVSQECLMAIHKSLASYDPSRPIKPWILALVKFKICDHFRALEKKSQEVAWPEHFDVTNPDESSNIEETKGVKEEYLKLIGQVPENARKALILVKIDGLTYKEASEQLGVNEATLRKRVSRAFGQLSKVAQQMEMDHV